MKFIRILKAEENLELVVYPMEEFEVQQGITYNAQLELWNGNTLEDSLLFNTSEAKSDDDIIDIAEEHFGTLPNNIKVTHSK